MPPTLSAEQRLARRILGQDLADWIAEQRHPFPDVTRSWENVARQLDKATEGDVSVTAETLRKWNIAWGRPDLADVDGAA